jgi:hypothetical protein
MPRLILRCGESLSFCAQASSKVERLAGLQGKINVIKLIRHSAGMTK